MQKSSNGKEAQPKDMNQSEARLHPIASVERTLSGPCVVEKAFLGSGSLMWAHVGQYQVTTVVCWC